MYKVEHGIELWSAKNNSNRKQKYPFGELEVGDSFFVPHKDVSCAATPFLTIRGSASSYGKRHGKKFAVRTCDNPNGYRVWRIK